MIVKSRSKAVIGLSSFAVDVEVDMTPGVKSFVIVGLPDTACRESAKRVTAAINNSGFRLPSMRITVNLAPAQLRKEGAMYDLAIAITILAGLDIVDKHALDNKVFCGELSLDGHLRPVKGALCIADALKQDKTTELIIPLMNMPEASAAFFGRIIAACSLSEVVGYLKNGNAPCRAVDTFDNRKKQVKTRNYDYSDIKGNANAKRAMEIAVAGRHNILLIGPPGTGKTMMAKRLPTIMSNLTNGESIETSKVYSICGLLPEKDLISSPPFIAFHHTTSDAGILGGGSSHLRPGGVSLAHNGILFMDELPEFRRNVLESLRQPLEDKKIRITRASRSLTYPCRFMLVAAMNPCPCGFLTHPKKVCTCTSTQIQRYLAKISGPLLDRIDIHVEVQPIKYEEISQKIGQNSSAEMGKRIKAARERQKARYKKQAYKDNAGLPHSRIIEYCQLTEGASTLLKKAMSELFVSARAYDKILKIARTIADIDNKQVIDIEQVSEAIGYRCLDTKTWL